jgi:hypothetical protein
VPPEREPRRFLAFAVDCLILNLVGRGIGFALFKTISRFKPLHLSGMMKSYAFPTKNMIIIKAQVRSKHIDSNLRSIGCNAQFLIIPCEFRFTGTLSERSFPDCSDAHRHAGRTYPKMYSMYESPTTRPEYSFAPSA